MSLPFVDLLKITRYNNIDSLLRVVLVPLGCLMVSTAAAHLSSGDGYWEAARITPSLAMAYGFPVYSSWDQGFDTNEYVSTFLCYCTCSPTALGKSPASVLAIGCVITQVLFFGPVLVAFLHSSQDKIIAFIAFSLFFFLASSLPPSTKLCFY